MVLRRTPGDTLGLDVVIAEVSPDGSVSAKWSKASDICGADMFDNCPTVERRASSISSLIVLSVKSLATVKINPQLF